MKISTNIGFLKITENRFFSPSWATKKGDIIDASFFGFAAVCLIHKPLQTPAPALA